MTASARTLCLSVLLLATGSAAADVRGHLKVQGIYERYPDASVGHQLYGKDTVRGSGELRLNLRERRNAWDVQIDWQGLLLFAESFADNALTPGSNAVIDDDRRWMKLTDVLRERRDHVALHRFDRFNLGYSGERWIWRFGRQAISWGNGLLYNPVDMFNPFDPAAVDKEYKSGDDMLYGQYLLDSGDDIQWVAVARSGRQGHDLDENRSSLALKYHGTAAFGGYDLLLAQHHEDTVTAFGWSASIGGALWNGDLMLTDQGEITPSLVSGISWSGTWRERNTSMLIEYFYNGFGITGEPTLARLRNAQPLLQRLERGELFTVARQYAAAAYTLEATPLLRLGSSGFVNLSDSSALWQLNASYDWRQNLQVLAAINVPIGPAGTEFGGIEANPGVDLASSGQVFLQLGWYF